MQINLTDTQINNLFTFLDRAEVKGLHEIQAMNEILVLLSGKGKEKETNKEEGFVLK